MRFPAFLAEKLAALMVSRQRGDLVFTSPERAQCCGCRLGGPGSSTPAGKRLMKKYPDFPTATPHDLRHTAASRAISAGANVKAVQSMLGHASAVRTLDTHADLFPDDLEQVSVALDVARTKLRRCCGPAADWSARRLRAG